MAGILRKLQECDYQGVLSAEILPKPTKEAAARGWIEAVSAMMRE